MGTWQDVGWLPGADGRPIYIGDHIATNQGPKGTVTRARTCSGPPDAGHLPHFNYDIGDHKKRAVGAHLAQKVHPRK